jgi:hypothetical protein
MWRRAWLSLTFLVLLPVAPAPGQVIEFESGGLKYQTLSKNGLTIMFAPLALRLREYAVLQVAVSNGSSRTCTIQPEAFEFYRSNGGPIQAASANTVVSGLLDRAGRSDVIKLVTTYENGLYGIVRFRSTNGYEQRRMSALAEVSSTKLKAAAAASAVALVETKLASGESTDGVVFFPTLGKPLGKGRLRVKVSGQIFEFQVESPDVP